MRRKNLSNPNQMNPIQAAEPNRNRPAEKFFAFLTVKPWSLI